MNVLVDTSVWVDHFKQRNDHLVALLDAGLVVGHPSVVVEVACGAPPRRRAVVATLRDLDSAPLATDDDLLELIDRRGLHGRGCGYVDVSLLASVSLHGQMWLWTLDKRLDAVAADWGRAYRPASPALR